MTRRKAYLVSMVQTSPDADPEFTSHYDAYWRAVDEHVASLEMRAGPVARVFVEGVGFGGEEGLLRVQQADRRAHSLVKSRVDSGAVLEPYEDQDLFEQVVDWGRILPVPDLSARRWPRPFETPSNQPAPNDLNTSSSASKSP